MAAQDAIPVAERVTLVTAATRGIDAAKVLAEFRAELKKVAAGN